MKPEKFFFPLMVFAAIVGVWMFLRKPQAVTQTQPSTSASGVPNVATESPTSYNVQSPQIPASPLVYLADPGNPDPTAPARKSPPNYLSFNFGPNHDLTKVPADNLYDAQKSALRKKSGCGGCGGDCNSCDQNANVFPDGVGRTPLSSSRRMQIEAAPRSFLEIAKANLDAQPETILNEPSPVPAKEHIQARYVGPALGNSVSLSHSGHFDFQPFDRVHSL